MTRRKYGKRDRAGNVIERPPPPDGPWRETDWSPTHYWPRPRPEGIDAIVDGSLWEQRS